ncbi:MAG: nucleoside deaminase [Bacteroidales bacterium]|nr:nucleoside deaminase [Bacteroidales bacterium]
MLTPDETFMQAALREAHKALEAGEVPIGAVVVCNGQIVGRGHNQTEMLSDVTAHAEIIALTAATQTLGGKYLTDCTLYVTVEPCCMCAGALAWAQLSHLVYGASDDKRGYSRCQPSILHPKTTVTSGILAEQCSQLMVDFFATKRK